MDDRRLRKFFHFTEEDLFANRRGQLSEQQKRWLQQEARSEQASARSSATILFLIAAAGLGFGLTIGSIARASPGGTLILLLMGILWPAVWASKGLRILRAAYARQKPRLRQVSGGAYIIQHADGSHGLKVGELEFDLDGNPAGVLREGEAYTLYHVEGSGELLSVEDRSTYDKVNTS